jgi:hypothetical protein
MKSSPKLSQSILIKEDQDSSEVVNLKIQALMEVTHFDSDSVMIMMKMRVIVL